MLPLHRITNLSKIVTPSEGKYGGTAQQLDSLQAWLNIRVQVHESIQMEGLKSEKPQILYTAAERAQPETPEWESKSNNPHIYISLYVKYYTYYIYMHTYIYILRIHTN